MRSQINYVNHRALHSASLLLAILRSGLGEVGSGGTDKMHAPAKAAGAATLVCN